MKRWIIGWLWMNVKRVRFGITRHPVFTIRVGLKRLAFFVTRKFVGDSIRSPITGEWIFNIQSLINYWAMHCIKELGTDWETVIRESASPVVFDVGSNIGQFRHLVLSLNPGARVITIDAWEEMSEYVPRSHHYPFAVIDEERRVPLTKSSVGLTASTSLTNSSYDGAIVDVYSQTLDSIWQTEGCPYVTVLKIDIDGAEFDALKGAAGIVAVSKIIIVETSDIGQVKRLCPNREWSTVNDFDWVGVKV